MHLMTHLMMLFVVIGAIKWIRASRCSRTAIYAAPEASRERGESRGGMLQSEVGTLKARIATLERIAVDGRSSAALAAEIDALRD
jgi:hypothetical protein